MTWQWRGKSKTLQFLCRRVIFVASDFLFFTATIPAGLPFKNNSMCFEWSNFSTADTVGSDSVSNHSEMYWGSSSPLCLDLLGVLCTRADFQPGSCRRCFTPAKTYDVIYLYLCMWAACRWDAGCFPGISSPRMSREGSPQSFCDSLWDLTSISDVILRINYMLDSFYSHHCVNFSSIFFFSSLTRK